MKTHQTAPSSNKNLLEDFFKNTSTLELQHEIMKPGENPVLSWFKYTSFTRPHKYIIHKNGQTVGFITEQISSTGLWFLRHIILRNRRPLHLILQDDKKNTLLFFHRPFYIWFSKLYTKDTQHKNIGYIQRKFSITHKKYHLFIKNTQPFGFIKAFFTKFWTFPILDSQRQSIGKIKKSGEEASKKF